MMMIILGRETERSDTQAVLDRAGEKYRGESTSPPPSPNNHALFQVNNL